MGFIIVTMASLIKAFRSIYNPITRYVHERWAFYFPKTYVKYLYKKILGKRLNLKYPKDLNEKIQWLKIFSDTTSWTYLTDKYKVREYVTQCGLSDILPKLYGVWDNANDIDFTRLPDEFILKTNQAYGRSIIVKDKSQIDVLKLRKQLNLWVKDRYGLLTFEPHCWNIQRKIIAEELFADERNRMLSTSLVDYKIWCFHGEPFLIMVLYDRYNEIIGEAERTRKTGVQACIYDMNWNLRPEILSGSHKFDKPLLIPKPACFEEMINVSRTLSNPFPQVRVDLYVVYDKVFFGELTFTSLGGYMDYFSDDYLLKMGEKIDLASVKLRTSRYIV